MEIVEPAISFIDLFDMIAVFETDAPNSVLNFHPALPGIKILAQTMVIFFMAARFLLLRPK